MVWLDKVCLLTLLHSIRALTHQLPDIYWNSSHPIFRIDNTDHIIDVNKGNIRFEYDQVNIICPVYSDEGREEDVEKYIIYNVSKEEYDTCRITTPKPRIIAVCDKPNKVLYFTITFRPFSPQPEGLEFTPGKDYYFISTSSRDDLYRTIGGRCTTHHMKVVFKVCCDPSAQPAHDQANVHHLPNPGLSTARSVSTTAASTPKMANPPVTNSFTTTTTTPPTTSNVVTTFHTSPSRRITSRPKTKLGGLKPYTGAKSSKAKKKHVEQKELTKSCGVTLDLCLWALAMAVVALSL